MVMHLSLAFPGGQPPGHPWGNPGNMRGNSAFFYKNVPDGRDIVWFLNQMHQIPGMHQPDMFEIGQLYFTFKIPDEHVDERPCCHLYGIS